MEFFPKQFRKNKGSTNWIREYIVQRTALVVVVARRLLEYHDKGNSYHRIFLGISFRITYQTMHPAAALWYALISQKHARTRKASRKWPHFAWYTLRIWWLLISIACDACRVSCHPSSTNFVTMPSSARKGVVIKFDLSSFIDCIGAKWCSLHQPLQKIVYCISSNPLSKMIARHLYCACCSKKKIRLRNIINMEKITSSLEASAMLVVVLWFIIVP